MIVIMFCLFPLWPKKIRHASGWLSFASVCFMIGEYSCPPPNNEIFSSPHVKFTSSPVVSSVRSSNSHPDLLVTHHPTHFFRSQRSSTLDLHFLSHYSNIKTIMLYKGNHWTRCAGFMVASWVRLGITNDDLGTSWALPGDNLGMTWG